MRRQRGAPCPLRRPLLLLLQGFLQASVKWQQTHEGAIIGFLLKLNKTKYFWLYDPNFNVLIMVLKYANAKSTWSPLEVENKTHIFNVTNNLICRRAVNWQNKNNRTFQCKFENKCEITIRNRKTCQSCRFQVRNYLQINLLGITALSPCY